MLSIDFGDMHVGDAILNRAYGLEGILRRLDIITLVIDLLYSNHSEIEAPISPRCETSGKTTQ